MADGKFFRICKYGEIRNMSLRTLRHTLRHSLRLQDKLSLKTYAPYANFITCICAHMHTYTHARTPIFFGRRVRRVRRVY